MELRPTPKVAATWLIGVADAMRPLAVAIRSGVITVGRPGPGRGQAGFGALLDQGPFVLGGPIDRHDALYSVDELLRWKADQVTGAGNGTHISDAEARRFAGLTPE